MKLPELIEGTFIKRISRFSANVNIEGRTCRAYVPNSGRMKELLIEGTKVFLAVAIKEERVTKYDPLLVDYNGALVSIDSRVPNLLLMEELQNGSLPIFEGKYIEVKREVTFGSSRFDFRVIIKDEHETNNEVISYLEAKSVTLVNEGTAMFPDAPTERGSKHLKELISAVEAGYRGIIIFVIQRSDAVEFRPHEEMDPLFSENLRLAKENGVEIYAYKCLIERNKIILEQQIPVSC